ncbi:MAG: glutamate-5-semialdehyde dehydrogenase [Myxococcales bacterium]|nr:MAG: glutamate-5-semialdehyde dehydrogenase [Myxococcales bacterium]
MTLIQNMLDSARAAANVLATSSSEARNGALAALAEALVARQTEILAENAADVAEAQKAGRPRAVVDRLALSPKRVEEMAKALREVAALPDPLGEIYDLTTRPNGLVVGRMRISLGVIAMIFESRPNVIPEAGSLCLKTGNAVVLRGGSEAARTNGVLGAILAETLPAAGLPAAAIQVVGDPDRRHVMKLLEARGKIDLLIPRGGESLIRFVDEHARVPVILHYKGVCHVYIDREANLEKGLDILENAKVQRPGVCNAAECLLAHADVAKKFLPRATEVLQASGVELRGCPRSRAIVPAMKEATDADWGAEYLDLILAVKVVDSLDEALAHIARYGSSHTEAIVTENYTNARKFLAAVQSSCVCVNASTRFNDGGQLGLGAEIGISTTRLHAYGPMGLKELTASKFVVLGSGQVRS